MTVAELIEWLKTQDQTATVEVVKHDRSGGFDEQGGTATVVNFTPKLSLYVDSFEVNGKSYPSTLLLGESD